MQNIIQKIVRIANILDESGNSVESDALTNVLVKISQTWQENLQAALRDKNAIQSVPAQQPQTPAVAAPAPVSVAPTPPPVQNAGLVSVQESAKQPTQPAMTQQPVSIPSTTVPIKIDPNKASNKNPNPAVAETPEQYDARVRVNSYAAWAKKMADAPNSKYKGREKEIVQYLAKRDGHPQLAEQALGLISAPVAQNTSTGTQIAGSNTAAVSGNQKVSVANLPGFPIANNPYVKNGILQLDAKNNIPQSIRPQIQQWLSSIKNPSERQKYITYLKRARQGM